ncbi:hypothetical protein P7K49_034005 [Saguinus oedipus]|uniref:Uncharacterized protein n=1 Tax=Saguinus oedipus TaxID=9490 RepID=A0ABQ9TTH9_SAGOE|nr:hypothetical protein P7K49_034005 [Saguinus oedipus]
MQCIALDGPGNLPEVRSFCSLHPPHPSPSQLRGALTCPRGLYPSSPKPLVSRLCAPSGVVGLREPSAGLAAGTRGRVALCPLQPIRAGILGGRVGYGPPLEGLSWADPRGLGGVPNHSPRPLRALPAGVRWLGDPARPRQSARPEQRAKWWPEGGLGAALQAPGGLGGAGGGSAGEGDPAPGATQRVGSLRIRPRPGPVPSGPRDRKASAAIWWRRPGSCDAGRPGWAGAQTPPSVPAPAPRPREAPQDPRHCSASLLRPAASGSQR